MRARTWMSMIAAVLACAALDATAASQRTERVAMRADRGWTMHLDNDLFAFADRDRDYTGGAAFTLGGDAARTHALSLAPLLTRLDDKTGFSKLRNNGGDDGHSLELGLLLFTPHDLAASEPLDDDRPYANLLYLSSSELAHDVARDVAYQSSLTLGVLGLPVAERLHRSVHEVFGSTEPRGYAHQISDGGEPTFRYAVSRNELLANGVYRGRPYVLRYGFGGSVGYLTEANAELAFRWGRTSLPWWSAPVVSSDYAGHPPVRPRKEFKVGRGMEVLIDAGVKVRLRLYNSFLQGQLRDSDVTYSFSELDHGLLEAWLGVTTVLDGGFSVSYTVRHQTEEIDAGPGSRSFTWASIAFAKSF